MPLTTASNIFMATREQAALVADCCGLRHEITSVREEGHLFSQENSASYYGGKHDLWQDSATGGGGCRIVWSRGVAWVSRHSGYEWADITEEACWAFRELGCKNAQCDMLRYNPHTYNVRDSEVVEAARKYAREGD